MIRSPIGWLNDGIISVVQMLILQQFPSLQPTTLAEIMAFQVHRGEFVQILHVEGCTVSNVDCDDGVVKVYDSMFSSVSRDTVH